MAMAFALSLVILVFSFFLIKIADWVVHLLRKFSLSVSASTFAVSSILVAVGSCLPEIIVAVTSALEGHPSLSLGNVLGSSVANVSFLLGFLAVFLGGVSVRVPFFRHDLKLVFLSLGILLSLVVDGSLSRLDGFILLLSYLFYIRVFISQSGRKEHFSFGRHLLSFFPPAYILDFRLTEEVAKIILGFGGLLISAWVVVRAAVSLASYLNVSFFAIGFVFIAMSTTLPELAFSVRAVKDRETPMFLGGLLGSLIANLTLVAGIVSLLSGSDIPFPHVYLRTAVIFLLFSILFSKLVHRSNRIERIEGVFLLLLYFVVLALEFF